MLQSIVFYLLLVGSLAFFLEPSSSFLDPKIVGGTTVDIKQHPYQLSLQETYHTCGATIISNKWAVTAAHCVSLPAKVYRLAAGNNNKYRGIRYPVKRIIRHPNYDAATIDYDIALLEIDGKITFSTTVQPVKLPWKEITNGVMANVTGWGAMTSSGKLSSNLLMKVTLPIVNREICQRSYKYTQVITDRMICAGYIRQGGKDACQGDSGGPLTVDDTLYGIVSWGYGCAQPNYPGVYTNVAYLRSWIKSISDV